MKTGDFRERRPSFSAEQKAKAQKPERTRGLRALEEIAKERWIFLGWRWGLVGNALATSKNGC